MSSPHANQRGYLLRQPRNLDTLRRDVDDPVVALLLSAEVRHVEAALAFVDDAEAALLTAGGQRAERSTTLPSAAPRPHATDGIAASELSYFIRARRRRTDRR